MKAYTQVDAAERRSIVDVELEFREKTGFVGRVVSVYSHTDEIMNGAGMIVDYVTRWEYSIGFDLDAL